MEGPSGVRGDSSYSLRPSLTFLIPAAGDDPFWEAQNMVCILGIP